MDEYKTKDLGLATFFSTKGIVLKRIKKLIDEYQPDRKIGIFIFQGFSDCSRLETIYFGAECKERMVDARKLIEAERRMKDVLYYNLGKNTRQA
jgi:hypothetical protein